MHYNVKIYHVIRNLVMETSLRVCATDMYVLDDRQAIRRESFTSNNVYGASGSAGEVGCVRRETCAS